MFEKVEKRENNFKYNDSKIGAPKIQTKASRTPRDQKFQGVKSQCGGGLEHNVRVMDCMKGPQELVSMVES